MIYFGCAAVVAIFMATLGLLHSGLKETKHKNTALKVQMGLLLLFAFFVYKGVTKELPTGTTQVTTGWHH